MVGGELAWQRTERVERVTCKTSAEVGGDALGVLSLAEQRASSGAHHNPTRVPASGRRNLLGLLLRNSSMIVW